MKPRAISLYTGIGGLDFGFEAAGFETAVALDIDPVACEAVATNRRWRVVNDDVRNVSTEALLDYAGLRVGQADVLIGGPPCQPFSKSGYWAAGDSARLSDPRSTTISDYLRVLSDSLPKTFLLENVPGLAFDGKSEGLELINRSLTEINALNGTHYRFHVASLNAADFGVPQRRERVFVVGSRDGRPFTFPRPTHAPKVRGMLDLEPYRTAWDALGDIPEDGSAELLMTGKWAALLPSIPEGHNYLWHTNRGGGCPLFGWRTRYWNFLLKLAKSQPSWTVQAQPGPATGPFHWHNRKLSPRELARIQTFPEGLAFDYRHSHVQRLIGNAVPSALAEILAREVKSQLLGQRLLSNAPLLVPPVRPGTPPPDEVSSVPARYLELLGAHEAHPGTGKGRRAIKGYR